MKRTISEEDFNKLIKIIDGNTKIKKKIDTKITNSDLIFEEKDPEISMIEKLRARYAKKIYNFNMYITKMVIEKKKEDQTPKKNL